MSNLQLIEELCFIVERQVRLIRDLADRLAQLDGLSEAEQEAIRGIEAAYEKAIGADEAPLDFE